MVRFILGLIGTLAFFIFWTFIFTEFGDYCKTKARQTKEWNTKVDNCVLNPNYRPDCNLILYRDAQIHNMPSRHSNTVVPVPMIVK